ncbi:metalloendopeptidase [Aureococcus anophagefferens]|nr:metalloendopeptidase [Aureococcus anophagefferens]
MRAGLASLLLGLARPMSALSARASLACPHLKLNFEASASEIAAKSAALVAGLDAAVARIASGDSGDAGADWIGATDAVAAASAESCASPATRKRAMAAGQSKCPENVARLNRIVELRAPRAAPRRGEPRGRGPIFQNGGDAGDRERLPRPRRVEAAAAPGPGPRAAAREEAARAPGAARVDAWDVAYYSRQIKADLGIDEESLKPFFPMDGSCPRRSGARRGVLGFSVDGPLADARLWHEDVDLYAIRDGATVLGHVALDLKSRPGKFGHQMVVPLRPAAGESPNACAVLGNMGDAAGFMRFREVETLLHELGHVFRSVGGRRSPRS